MRQLITTIQQTTLATEDGAFVALWILTLIDHWNNEHERIIVLTERSFYIIKYDFLHGNIRESRRVGLGQLVSVTTGPLVFPTKSLMPYAKIEEKKKKTTMTTIRVLGQYFYSPDVSRSVADSSSET
ncbi:unnamed protein product [Dibothriocephalus latus]|uniref:HSac2 domain-containing protein n=1 Tax=Dibothriocephalus latus TaxID=60516 RepID=A0A3P7M2I9_DIBLA|nr:unnamed protein product [Dibothriocephalus latus]